MKKEIDLDSEKKVQNLENYADDFNTSMKKNIFEVTKSIFIILVDIILLTLGIKYFNNPLTKSTGLALLESYMVFNMSIICTIRMVDLINIDKKSSSNKEKESEEILSEDLKKTSELNHKKCKDIIETQKITGKEQNNYPNLNLIKDNKEQLSKDETMIKIVEEMDDYSMLYEAPDLEISNESWDTYFDTIHEKFVDMNMESDFYDKMSQLTRAVYSKALDEEKDKIDILDFVDNVDSLGLNEKDTLNIKNNILKKLRESKVVDFKDYQKGRR